MHLRRALLLFALVLGLTALATSIAPSPRSSGPAVPPPPAQPGAAKALAPPGVPAVTFTIPVKNGRPHVQPVGAGEHVVVVVSSTVAGQASIPSLGRTASVQPGTPATFDVLVPAPGRYDVVFSPPLGVPVVPIGTLLVRG